MAHWAKIENGIVVSVIATDTSLIEDGEAHAMISDTFGGTWIQTSYNTAGGKHLLGGTPLRKNYAGIGFAYDETLDAFIPPIPEGDGWVLNQESCMWENPALEIYHIWDEQKMAWSTKVPTTSPDL